MKMRMAMIGFALIAPLSVAWGAKSFNPDTLTKVPCSDLHFSAAFLQRYPKAPAEPASKREAKDGTRYAKFHARVFLNSSDRTTVNILDANGAMKTTFSFRASPRATIQAAMASRGVQCDFVPAHQFAALRSEAPAQGKNAARMRGV